jgi:hypothetical protein
VTLRAGQETAQLDDVPFSRHYIEIFWPRCQIRVQDTFQAAAHSIGIVTVALVRPLWDNISGAC